MLENREIRIKNDILQ